MGNAGNQLQFEKHIDEQIRKARNQFYFLLRLKRRSIRRQFLQMNLIAHEYQFVCAKSLKTHPECTEESKCSSDVNSPSDLVDVPEYKSI